MSWRSGESKADATRRCGTGTGDVSRRREKFKSSTDVSSKTNANKEDRESVRGRRLECDYF